MPKVAAILGFFLVVSGCISAQTHEVVAVRGARADQPIKFDEFGQLGHCDVTGRLDAFAIQLESQPAAKGAIVSYAPEGDGYGTGKRVLLMLKDYLVNARGIPEDRIETIYGGRNSDKYHSQTELWIVPQGVPLPKTKKRQTDVDTFQGLYYEGDLYDDFGVDVPAEMGPGIGGSVDASFADMLHQQKNATGYIVVYSGEDLTPGAWRRVGQSDIDSFKGFNLEPNRFKLIFGGQQKESHVQYWILPNNAPPPVREAGEEKALAKTVKVGDFSVYNLDEENNQKAIFSRLTEILTLDKTVRAFLVVTLNEPDPEEETTEQVAPIEPVDEKPPVDLTKLVEKWRTDLANTHKIGPDRLIIVFTSEPFSGNLSLWIVPKGEPLPNPKEDDTPAEP